MRGESEIASQLSATATLIEQHAAAMVEHGQRLAVGAKASSGPLLVDFFLCQPKHCSIEINIFSSGEFRVKAAPQL